MRAHVCTQERLADLQKLKRRLEESALEARAFAEQQKADALVHQKRTSQQVGCFEFWSRVYTQAPWVNRTYQNLLRQLPIRAGGFARKGQFEEASRLGADDGPSQ